MTSPCIHHYERGGLVKSTDHPVVGRILTYRYTCTECGQQRLGDERPQQFAAAIRATSYSRVVQHEIA